jgi:sucrose-6-phosphate hydrolase SacC (GH32 family)
MAEDHRIAVWHFDEGAGSAAREAISGLNDTIDYVFSPRPNIGRPRFTPPSDPLWREGIRGRALLFDGYSTWVTHPLDALRVPSAALTISVWVAPRTFEAGLGDQLSAIVNQHDRLAEQGFLLGTSTHGAWSLQIGTGDRWLEVWSHDRRLPRHAWAHVVATFDSRAGRLCLYLDGEQVAEQDFEPGLALQPALKDLVIGKHNTPTRIGVYEANMFDGLIDELTLEAVAWDAQQVRAAFEAYLLPHGGVKPAADTRADRRRYAGDVHRPQYHFVPPHHWMNEPHALLHFKGKYHITYQHNAHAPFWHNITWGHAISDDLVRWKDLPDAIITEKDSVAPDGIWSGSASVDTDGCPVYFFTAGNNAMNPNQMTGLARSTYPQDGDLELKRWIVHDRPVTVLDQTITINGHKVLPHEFRDAYVWREGDIWCQLVGAGVENVGGTALLYTSADLTDWTYRGPFLVGDMQRYPLVSMMWELPVLLPLGRGKHIFLYSPWWAPGHPSAHFLKYVPYWIGTWDADGLTFTPDHDLPQIFDYGEHFTGPSGTVDEHGRSIVLNIAQMKRDPQMSYDSGWDGNAGLPIQLFLHDDGHLGVRPVPELEALRGPCLATLENVTLAEANGTLARLNGRMLEIQFEARIPAQERCGVKVRRTPDGVEETLIYYDGRHGTFNINRDRSSLTANVHQRGTQGGPLHLPDGVLRLRIYVDHSMIEAYANERKSITSRAYPSRNDATGLLLWGSDDLRIERFTVWVMRSAYNE